MTTTAMGEARAALSGARRVAVLTGAGISAESGVPTFRGAGGLWRRFSALDLATPEAWADDPGLVWEFYDYRRRVMADKAPNAGHQALAAFEARLAEAGRPFTLVTQNVDGLHEVAGSSRVVHLHGSLWRVRCVGCGRESENRDVPITPAYEGAGDPGADVVGRGFGPEDLPRCGCGGVVRPAVVWFGESLRDEDLRAAFTAAAECDALLVVGTSAVVYPAAGLVPHAKRGGAVVIEVNLEETPATAWVDHHLTGPSGEVLPELLAP
ncbi:MAG: NAD-dependent deacylase [Deltaproteobacteria bacterium]|nr:NAD-dependent deacylase [Deltaproteobacteria bacterium]